MKKLVQIKEFTNNTVTQEFAAQISAICIWNHYKDDEYKDKGFRIANGEPKGVVKGGGGSKFPWKHGDDDSYIKTATGVEIYTSLEDRVRIFESGNVIASWRESDHGDYEYITRNKHTLQESHTSRSKSFSNSIAVVQLYLDHGFFELQEVEL